MKKWIAFCLAIASMLCLAACSSDDPGTSSDQNPTTSQKSTAPVYPEIDPVGVNEIEGIAEFEIVKMYQTDDVMPPKPSGFYTHYTASPGNTYMVVVMNVKNLTQSSVKIGNLFQFYVTLDEKGYDSTATVEAENGSDLDSSYVVSPLETVRAHYLVQVPAGSDLSNVPVSFRAGDLISLGDLNINQYADATKPMKKGQRITDKETIEITLKDVYTTTALYPPNPDGYYHYFESSAGKVYLVMQFTVKNLKGNEMKYDTIAGVNALYKGKYRYSSFPVFSDNGGSDLSSYTNVSALAPLASNTVYYLMEIPKEAQNGPIEISVYVAGQDYIYNYK